MEEKIKMIEWLIGGVLEGIRGKTVRQVEQQLQAILVYINQKESK